MTSIESASLPAPLCASEHSLGGAAALALK